MPPSLSEGHDILEMPAGHRRDAEPAFPFRATAREADQVISDDSQEEPT
jgi:hypothetical protein